MPWLYTCSQGHKIGSPIKARQVICHCGRVMKGREISQSEYWKLFKRKRRSRKPKV